MTTIIITLIFLNIILWYAYSFFKFQLLTIPIFGKYNSWFARIAFSSLRLTIVIFIVNNRTNKIIRCANIVDEEFQFYSLLFLFLMHSLSLLFCPKYSEVYFSKFMFYNKQNKPNFCSRWQREERFLHR